MDFGITTRQNFGAAARDPKAEKLRVNPAPRKALLGQLTLIFSAVKRIQVDLVSMRKDPDRSQPERRFARLAKTKRRIDVGDQPSASQDPEHHSASGSEEE